MRRLADALKSLYNFGHFDFYPDYCYDISVSEPEEFYRAQVLALETEKSNWEKHVSNVRLNHYFINYFDLKRCYSLKCMLEEQTSPSAEFGSAISSMDRYLDRISKFICFVNPEFSCDAESSIKIGKDLLQAWNDDEEAKETLLSESVMVEEKHFKTKVALSRLARSLDKVFSTIPRRLRKLDVSGIDEYVVNEKVSRGIHVAYGNSVKLQYDQLLTLCAIQGEFPEWENILFCNKSTTVEQLTLLIHRWHRAHLSHREGFTYAMIEADALSYEAQHSAVQLIRELGPTTSANGPLIIIAESGDNCHIAAQFQFNRINHGILPDSCLSLVGRALSDFGRGMTFGLRSYWNQQYSNTRSWFC
jgi:hypothetical protein